MKDTDKIEVMPGKIEKAASIANHTATEDDLKAINKYALTPLTADEVFTFSAVLCDNDIDRQYERFTLKALQDLQKLFVGKTVIKDHYHSADNQVARIYATELQQGSKNVAGELYTKLVAKIYMVKTASNADLIAEIKGGIKKEGSVGCAVTGSICSICGTDNTKSYCRHWAGKTYDKEGGKQLCTFTLTGASDAYEFSLVAVPAQKAAGVSKSYTGVTVYAEDVEAEEAKALAEAKKIEEEKTAKTAKALELRTRIAAIKAKNTNP